VAVYAQRACTPCFVMMVLLAAKIRQGMTFAAKRVEAAIRQLAAMWIMAVRAGYPLLIHPALNKRAPLIVLL
jgi:hypothetical protein